MLCQKQFITASYCVRQFLLHGPFSRIIYIDISYTIILLYVSAYRSSSGINTVLQSPVAHLLFFPTMARVLLGNSTLQSFVCCSKCNKGTVRYQTSGSIFPSSVILYHAVLVSTSAGPQQPCVPPNTHISPAFLLLGQLEGDKVPKAADEEEMF